MFIIQAAMLGLALAMDAFSISVANGINESGMSRRKTLFIPLTFAFFQFIMPLAGWFLITVMKDFFEGFQRFVPFIALILLFFIGARMIASGIREIREADPDLKSEIILDPVTLFVQGIATSIDALSVGLTISDYSFVDAMYASLIIALVTFAVCMTGIRFGKRIGDRISVGAGILGGMILIVIGFKIFLSGI